MHLTVRFLLFFKNVIDENFKINITYLFRDRQGPAYIIKQLNSNKKRKSEENRKIFSSN